MTYSLKSLLKAGAVAVVVLGATPAFAAGADTNAGTVITNDAVVDYSVGGVAQTQITYLTQPSARNQITVDRKVTLLVAQLGSATTTVVNGQTQAATTFTVQNTTNGVIDIGLAAANLATGTAAPNGGSADAFNVGTFTYYLDNGTTAGVFDAGDTLITYLDEMAEDETRTVHVVASIPLSATNGQKAVVSLTGTAELGGTAGTEGAVLTNTTGANTAGVDNVFADASGTDDNQTTPDGKHSARDDYTVSTATLAVQKIATVISDPINGTSSPKMIPGAVVEYCIAITNSGSVAATGVSINDNISALPVTYDSVFGVKTNGTISAGVCTAGAGTGSFAAGVVSATGLTVGIGAAPANTNALVFRVTIN